MQLEKPEQAVCECEVLVIGGGPAGSTISWLLKQRGRDVALFEKAQHPRFHIGESLLPMNLPLLERLGVLEQVRKIGMPKYAADFTSGERGGKTQAIYFRDALDKNHPGAFQVRRSEFDQLLFDNAAAAGVNAQQGIKISSVELLGGEGALVQAVDAQGNSQQWRARYLVDASGRDTVLARTLGIKVKNPKHQSAAVFGHFADVTRRPGKDAGNISVYWFEHGWFWMIPLRDGAMSVGAVCWPEYLKTRTSSPAEFLWETIRLCPGVHQRMQDATLIGEANATGNYSYRAERMYGDGYLLVGDAYAFVDPVFSSGVHFAMNSAALGAEAVDAWLDDPVAARKQLQHFERRVVRGLKTLSWLIYRFTTPATRSLFMAPRNPFRMQEAITSLLAGDVFRDTPIRTPFMMFKIVYGATLMTHAARSWTAWRFRRRNAGVGFSGGTTYQDPL